MNEIRSSFIEGLSSRYTPGQELSMLLDIMRWTRGDLAKELWLSKSSINDMVNGVRSTPTELLVWLRGFAVYYANHPAPDVRKRKT